MECIICAYAFDSTERLPALTVCDHNNICSFCFLRMRSLQKNFNCPTCKRDLEHVICTDKKDALFSHYSIWGESIGEDFVLDQKSRMFIPKKYSKSKVEPLWLCKCNCCNQSRRDLKSLRGHLIADHNLNLCMLCAEHKQAFPAEQKIYTKAQYDKHLRQGDGDGGNGHPNCEFCRQRFYDSTALFVHLNKDHYSCHLCDKAGIKFRYFNNYPDLEAHYRRDHFICEERSCLEKQFIAFANEIDLAAHNHTWHPGLSVKKNVSIPMNFKTHRDEVRTSKRGDEDDGEDTDRRTSRYEGGLGGRANEGEWQVELQPHSAPDPRDPARHNAADVAASFASELAAATAGPVEDFPALATSNAPIGSFYSGITSSNKWVSIGGSNKTKKSDFPELKGNNNNNSSNSKKSGSGQKTVGRGGASHVSNIEMEYAHTVAAASSSTTASAPANQLNNGWVTMKVDKRLAKKQQQGANDSSAVKGKSNAEQESLDLALAMSASMISNTQPVESSKPSSSAYVAAAQKEAVEEWTTVEKPVSTYVPPPPPSNSEEAFPSLGGSSSKPPQPPPSHVKVVKKIVPNRNTSDILKAAGVAGGFATKKASKISVVRTQKPSGSSSPVERTANSPPGLTMIGKNANQEPESYAATRNSPVPSGGSGWATIGGAPKSGSTQPSFVGSTSSQFSSNTNDFPGLKK